MKNICRMLFLSAAVILLICCTGSTEKTPAKPARIDQMSKVRWLIGSWQNVSAEGTMKEMWSVRNDSVFAGRSYFIKGRDTLSSESITLEQRGNDLYYIPTVKDQNAGKPVEFKLSSSANNNLVFENPAHDFPQKISYTQVSKDSLMAEISGMIGGQARAEQFPMGRVK